MAERFCFDGVVEEWDRTDSIRERVRCGQFLEDDSQGADANNKAAALNSEVIVPLLVGSLQPAAPVGGASQGCSGRPVPQEST